MTCKEALEKLKIYIPIERGLFSQHNKEVNRLIEIISKGLNEDQTKIPTLEEVKKEWEKLGYEWKENIYVNSIGLRKVVKEKFFAGEHEVTYLIIIDFVDKTYSATKGSCFTKEGIKLTLQEHNLLIKTFRALGWCE